MSWLPWLVDWDNIRYLLESGWHDIVGTDFDQIKYSEINLALYIALIVAGVVASKALFVLFGRKKYSQKISGHFISKEDKIFRQDRESKIEIGLLARILLILPRLILVAPIAAVLLAIANPFFNALSEEKHYIETRVRVDARDLSSSMSAQFKGSNKSKAEIAMDTHLRFLEMRRGKGDRTSFWTFSNNPYLQQGFTIDEESYYWQVYDAPWEISNMDPDQWTEEKWNEELVSRSRYSYVRGEGGTNMAPLFRAVVKQFDEDDKKHRELSSRVVGRALLVITDAAISDFDKSKPYIETLRKKGVKIYIIWINEKAGESHPDQLKNINPLLQEVISSGGRYFPISSPDSLLKAYREIDRLEKTKIEISKKIYRVPVFYKFIFIAVSLLITIIPLGIIVSFLSSP